MASSEEPLVSWANGKEQRIFTTPLFLWLGRKHLRSLTTFPSSEVN